MRILVQKWEKYETGSKDPHTLGYAVGFFKPNVMSYVGYGTFEGRIVPGRLQTVEPSGLYYPANWKINYIPNDVYYLLDNSTQTYAWVEAFNGWEVENAIVVGEKHKRSNIVRIEKGDFVYMGKTHLNANAHYEDEHDKEVPIKQYQVLTCTVNPK